MISTVVRDRASGRSGVRKVTGGGGPGQRRHHRDLAHGEGGRVGGGACRVAAGEGEEEDHGSRISSS